MDHREGLPGSFNLFECGGCGLVRTEPLPENLDDYYPPSYTNHLARPPASVRASLAALRALGRPERSSLVARMLAWVVPGADLGPPIRRGARVLDVGAGNGGAVAALRRAGLDAWGIEPADAGIAVAHQNGLETVVQGTLEASPLVGEQWDLIRFTHVLEHVPSPVATLRTAAGALAPRGRVVILVPNFGSAIRRLCRHSWDGLEVPRHLHHFTRRTLSKALTEAGLDVQSMRTAALFGVLPASLDAWTCAGTRQRGWGSSIVAKLISYPIELMLGSVRLGDGIVVVAGRDTR